MHRATAATLALVVAASLGACSKRDLGNGSIVGEQPSPAAATSAPSAPGGPLHVDAKDNAFEPKDLAAAAGDVTITLKDVGASPHTFTSKELGVDQKIDAGKTVDITLKGVKAGSYKFVCIYHESLGMVGTLTVS